MVVLSVWWRINRIIYWMPLPINTAFTVDIYSDQLDRLLYYRILMVKCTFYVWTFHPIHLNWLKNATHRYSPKQNEQLVWTCFVPFPIMNKIKNSWKRNTWKPNSLTPSIKNWNISTRKIIFLYKRVAERWLKTIVLTQLRNI